MMTYNQFFFQLIDLVSGYDEFCFLIFEDVKLKLNNSSEKIRFYLSFFLSIQSFLCFDLSSTFLVFDSLQQNTKGDRFKLSLSEHCLSIKVRNLMSINRRQTFFSDLEGESERDHMRRCL